MTRPRNPKWPFPQPLPGSWTVEPLGECCLYIRDGDWIETKDQGGGDYRLLQISNIGVGRFVETGNFRWITQATFDRLQCTELHPGHILVSRMPEPVGRAWLVQPTSWRAVTAVDVAILDPNPEKLDARFCTYYLNSPYNLAYANARATGTTRPRITRRDLTNFPIPLPPMAIQVEIAAILGAYDDLIENSQRRINALEEMARLTFRGLLGSLISGELDESELAARGPPK